MKPQCLKCRHYFATYDPHTPRGCRKYGFRSATMPSVVIKRETGEECLAFEERSTQHKKDAKKMDLNDPDLW